MWRNKEQMVFLGRPFFWVNDRLKKSGRNFGTNPANSGQMNPYHIYEGHVLRVKVEQIFGYITTWDDVHICWYVQLYRRNIHLLISVDFMDFDFENPMGNKRPRRDFCYTPFGWCSFATNLYYGIHHHLRGVDDLFTLFLFNHLKNNSNNFWEEPKLFCVTPKFLFNDV